MNYLSKRMHNAYRAIQRHGVAGYLRRLGRSLVQTIYKTHQSTVFSRELNDKMTLIPAKLELDVLPWSEERRDDLFNFLGQFERFDQIQQKLDSGWLPMFGYSNNELVAISWYSFKPIYMTSIETFLNYNGPIAYIEGTRTLEKVQGKSIATAIRTHICKYLFEQGCMRAFVCSGDDNVASQTVARKCGFTPYERIMLTKILFWRRHSRTKLVEA